MSSEKKSDRRPAMLASMLLVPGVLHFVAPKNFDHIVPKFVPMTPRQATNWSGVAEIGLGAAILHPKTRRLGALGAAALLIAVYPANIQMAVDWWKKTPLMKLIGVARLPLQFPLITFALRVAKNAKKS